ncbi:hypothetical protein PV327_007009 [Microctonus hyperodae]|uniref:Tubulin alpha chain n=2 Tax=Microctonus hyperodae TaxID=165561 RepID=A0AA39F5H1_MICHY|nr:hypothetical protein PV327_007009 [Microctonus hyperodae]
MSFIFFLQSGKFTPRSVMIDLEPNVINQIRTGDYQYLFDPSLLITGKENAANNFARGYYTLGQEIIELVLERIQRICEASSNLPAFLIFRSLGGGTGSGFTTLLLEQLSNDYKKVSKFDFSIYPASNISTSIVEPYNAILTTHYIMDYEHCCFVLDNEALYDICARRLGIERPTYMNINRLEAQVVSATTASSRFEGAPNVGLDILQTALVPYPRIHFPSVAYSPITNAKSFNMNVTVSRITHDSFEPTNQMIKCDLKDGAFMSCCLLYRGNVALNDVNKAIDMLKGRKSIQFVNWTPTGFKIGINYQAPTTVPDGELGTSDRSVTMLCNNTVIKNAWKRLLRKYKLMFRKKAFLHHYIGEGMEESQFVEAQEDIQTLIRDYQEVENT